MEKLPLTFLEQIPTLSPPPGQVSNFVDPPNLIMTVAAVLAVTSLVMTMAVALRIYSKITSSRSFTWDDCGYCSLTYNKSRTVLMQLADTSFLAMVIIPTSPGFLIFNTADSVVE